MLKCLRQFCRRSTFVEKIVYLYILILPIDFGSNLILHGKKLQYVDALFPILFIFWCLYKFRSNSEKVRGRLYTTHIIIALFLVLTLCSLINSINFGHSIVEWLGLLYLVMLFLIICDTINDFDKLKRLLAVYFLSATIASIAGLAAFLVYVITRKVENNPFLFYWASESSILFFPRIKSFFYTPNMFVSFEHVGMTAAIGLLSIHKADSRIKILAFISMVITIIAVFLSASQCLAGVLMTFFIVSLKLINKTWRIVKYVILILVCAVTTFAFFSAIWMIYPVKIDNNRQDKTVAIRINYAYSHHIIPSIYGFSMFLKHPFFGVGIGTFADQYPKFIKMDIEKISSIKMRVSPYRILDPHNTYMGALAEYGLLGFLTMIVLFINFITMLFMYNRKNLDILSHCLLAGLIGFLFNAFFVDILMMRHFWIFLAMIFIFCINRKELCCELKI